MGARIVEPGTGCRPGARGPVAGGGGPGERIWAGDRSRDIVGLMAGASDSEAREFATAFRSFLDWVHSEQDGARRRNEVAALVSDFLGDGASGLSVVARSMPVFEQVNLQTALNAWSREPGREVAVHGISIPPHHSPVSLQQLITGEGMTPLRLSAPALVDLPNGPRLDAGLPAGWRRCWSTTSTGGTS